MSNELVCPNEYDGFKRDNVMVFLAGPIQGAPKWQEKMSEDLSLIKDLLVCNPRRNKKDDKFDYNQQVTWESKYLNLSDVIVFWIPKEYEKIEGRDYGQTTRIELGEWACKTNYKKIIVGIDDSFTSKRYIKKRLLDDYGIEVLDTYKEVLKQTKETIKELQKNHEIYYTSDTHYGSERALELSKRPFRNVIDMDNTMMLNWNSIVKPLDTVYHLGDFGNYDMLKNLNGEVILIAGNYEYDEMKKSGKTFPEFRKELKSKGFKDVLEDLLITKDTIYKFKDFDKKLDLDMYITHEPLKTNREMFNLFGHIHGRQMCKRYGLDAGVDAHHFKPISTKTVLFYKEAIEKFYDDNVFE